MADNLGGLFDSDPGFLEELASGTEDQQPQPMQGMIPQQNIGMIQQQQPQRPPQAGYNNIPTNNYGNVQYQNQQQQFVQQSNFNQFNNQQMYNQNVVVSQSQGHMMQNASNQSQFAVGQSSGMIQPQGQVMYNYNAGGTSQSGQRLPTPAQPQQQQIKVMGMQGWNQNPQMYNQQQAPTQQPVSQAPQQYLAHHDYPASNATGQQPMHIQQQQQGFSNAQPQQNQAAYMQRMASPTRIQTSQSSQPNMIGMQNQMYQQSNVPANQNFANSNINQTMTSDSMMMSQQQQQTGNFMQQNQQSNNGQYQQFPYHSPPQGHSQNMPETGASQAPQQNIMRFPQTSPTQQNAGHRMQYNSMSPMQQPRGANPMLSPRPTPPPASPSMAPGMLSPTGSTSSHQGSFNSMEPSPQANNTTAMFQQNTNSDMVLSDLNQPNFSQPQNNDQMASAIGNQGNNMNLNVHGNNFQNNQGQLSPNFKGVSPTSTGSPSKKVQAEIQALNQQIQQLYSVPQTPQTQQKMLDLQEKLRQLKSQPAQTNSRAKKGKNSKKQQAQQQQIQIQPQTQQQQNQLQPQTQQQQIQMQQQQPMMNQLQPQQVIPQQQMAQSGQQMPHQTGTVTLQISNQGQPNQGTMQPGQKIHLVQATGPQKVFIIQQPGQQAMSQQSQQMVSSSSLPQPQTQHIIINSGAGGAQTQHLLIQNAAAQPGQDPNKNDTVQQQEKANKIIAEAIAKAQKAGNTAIPRVLDPPELPSTLTDLENPDLVIAENSEKPKKKRRTPKKDKDNKEKTPRVRKPKKDKKATTAAAAAATAEAPVAVIPETVSMETGTDGKISDVDVTSTPDKPKKPKRKRPPSEKKADGTPKSSKKSKKPPATFLKSKKRKRHGSSDGSDVELKITPPPSPENDEFKRRSGRVKRKKYLDDVDLNLSDDDLQPDTSEGAVQRPVQSTSDNPAEEDSVIVDKILGSRMRQKDPDDENADEEEVEEYFVKYKNFSYLHCEWKTEEEIKDKRIQGKIKRFKLKKQQVTSYFDDDEEFFNPDYVEVDRVLEESFTRDPQTGEEVVHYLVKWRSLPYEDSTWELQQDVDPEKVKLFKKFRELPPLEERKRKPRPKPSEWVALDQSHCYKNTNSLREYQLEGVNWLTFCWHKKNNCILADEMGLGKTIQSIAYLQEIFSYGIKGPFLVVAPLSTIANWQREFETWTDMNAITYHGTSPSRYMLQEYEMYYRDEEGNKIKDCYRFHALITTYELILSDMDLLKTIDWRALIVDEAHRLKNKNCSLIKGLRTFTFEHKVLLSGTPLQNNVEELFSLLNFLEPSQFACSDAFSAEFGTLKTEEQVEKLKAILKPMMLRRLKEDVEKNLAAKEETIIEVELTNIQKKYYRAILERNFTYLCKGTQTAGNVPSLMNTMMELRKCCNHPYLINGAEENILAELRSRDGKEPEHIQALIQASGKFVLLDKLLPKLKQNGNRVLIFSQMIRVLDIIEDYLIHKRYMYERLDGRIRGNLRQEAIDRYSKPDSDRFVFLICTKAGGLGINLTAADTVIIYDSDWNPQNDLQAQARCHRIGQSKMVMVYRLVTRNSYEREMFDRASMKLGLDRAVLQSMGSDKISPQLQLSKREIEDLLKKGAYGALMEDDNAGDKFCEEDIDQILKGRTQVIQIESEGKGSTFSKASFSVTSNRDDIDINDPEFWQKWAKKADVDIENLDKRELIVDEPRVRKKTARYGNNDSLADISDLGSDSNSDEDSSRKGRKSRRGRRGANDDDDDFERERHKHKAGGGGYGRSELFKVEKGLLHYGWGRWNDIMSHARFKRPMDEKDVENVAKAILLYGLQFYKGDERIKEFIFDLVSHTNHEEGLKNHSGLSAPVPRGRKGKKVKNDEPSFDASVEIEKAGIKIDRDIVLNKNAYRRHIQRHSNKVLLRVRTLYYLKHEVLGDAVEQIDQGKNVREIQMGTPIADTEPPQYWWDELADKSLLIGVYKHGYEKYNLMRQDPCLVFLSRCGPPDNAALAAELKDDDDNENDDMDDTIVNDDDESLPAPEKAMTPRPAKESGAAPEDREEEEGKLPFPTVSELNTRLRRIITMYQRDFKKQQLKIQQQAKRMEKREKLDAMFREREARRRETLQKTVPTSRWTRREEMDFYRVVSTYGIEFDRVKGRYIWDKFRVMARLDKKTDEQLTEYFISFYHMCLRVCRKIKEEAYPPTPVYIEPITEERANRCIARIDLLSKIREEIIIHPRMEARIRLCKPSLDLPRWWSSGKHDRELLVGAAKHGLARTEFYIMNDPSLCFLGDMKTYMQNLSTCNSPASFKKEDKADTPDREQPSDKMDDDKVEKTSVKSEVKTEENIATEKDGSAEKPEMDNSKENKDKDAESEKTTKEEKVDSEVKEENMETDESDIKKEVKDEVKEENADVKTEMDVDEKVEMEVKEEKKEEEKDGNETEVKKEKSEKESEDQTEVETEDKDGIKSEDMKEEADEEVRMAMEGEESQSELLYNVSDSLLSQWPKDRVVFHRLEQICYCIETGEWPFPSKMKNVHILGIDSNSNTPTRSSTPSCSTPKQDDESFAKETVTMATPSVTKEVNKKEKEYEAKMAEQSEGSKMSTFQKKAEEQKHALEVEAEKAAKIQAILAQSLAASQASSEDSQPEPAFSQGGADSPFLNGSHMSEEEMLMSRTLMEQGMMFARGRRGRKRKAEKMAEIAMAEALARRQTARALATLDSDARVPLINLEDGSRLTGEEAPRKRELEGWLDQHPGFMVDTRDMEEIEEGEIVPEFPERRKGRKPKFDPAFLEADKLTGEENVSVINRLTGKKITGAKAPPLRYLAEWLEQNPMWDVDPKWADLVRAKGSLPKSLLARVVPPSRRGRRPRESSLSHSIGGVTDPHQAAALAASIEAMNAANLMAAGYGKLPMPFGSLPGLGMNPLLGLSGFGFPGMPLGAEKSETSSKDPKCSKEDGEKGKDDEKASSSSPHPSFPFMFNPLMYNPALLASQGLNFPLPTSLSASAAGLINGHPHAEEEPVKTKSKSRHSDNRDPSQAEDLSVKSKSKKLAENTTEAHSSGRKSETKASSDDADMPCDLSLKPKSKEDKSKQKICSSDKLSRIVDTLKFRVNKMDDKPSRSGHEEYETRKSSLDSMAILKEKASASKRDHSEPSSSKKELMNSLSQKIASSAAPNHASKEPLPKIVEELLAAKQLKDREEMLYKQQQKLDSLMLKKEKLLMEAMAKQMAAAGAQGSEVRERSSEVRERSSEVREKEEKEERSSPAKS